MPIPRWLLLIMPTIIPRRLMPMNQIMVFTIDRKIWMILGMKSPTFVIELLILLIVQQVKQK
uniref:Uncharacterized protein n=2 Tax=Picea TaxID=3328 RepID=A0A124GNF6_PICGL|nr:hypothetical protein ABT39_MTgene4681 [Picea glauca]QHR89782.1 hypothetical protein Q903MT_gene3804 [Picea sitchensis]